MEKEINSNYLKMIQKYPLLTSEEELDLSRKIQKGDKNALQSLINSNLRLVVSIAHKFRSNSISVMDLVQEGNMGLMVAAQKFSWSFKTRFSTYAYPWIVQYMIRYANSHSSMIMLPHRKDDMIRKIQNAQNYFFQQYGREATITELAQYLNITEEKATEILSYSYSISSLDIDAGTDSSSATIGDLIADTDYTPEENLLRNENKEYVCNIMKALPVNERKVLWYRYNFENELKPKTLREISKIIGVSPEAVRQTELRALKHLKQAANV